MRHHGILPRPIFRKMLKTILKKTDSRAWAVDDING